MSPEDNRQLREGARVLVDDHAEVDELIRSLLAALDDEDVALSFERMDLLWARLAVHIRAEHLCLFPSILGALGKSSTHASRGAPSAELAREVLERLRADHDFFMVELAGAVNTARQWFDAGSPPSAEQFREIKGRVQLLCDRLVEHNRVEEEQVYLWPEMLLSAQARREMSARMKREIENLPPRFSAHSSRQALS